MSTTAPEAPYFAREAAASDEQHRLSLINQLYDPSIQESLARLVHANDTVAEIGYGNGLVLRWLAERVGSAGRVVGIDLTRNYLLTELPENVELHEANIANRPLERATYNLIYTRLLLAHLPDPLSAVRHFAESLTSNGSVVVCDLYFPGMHPLDRNHPRAEPFERALREVIDGIERAGVLATSLGPRLGDLLAEAGLANVRSRVVSRDDRGGGLSARVCTEGLKRVMAVLPHIHGPAEILLESWSDPTFRFRDVDLYIASATKA